MTFSEKLFTLRREKGFSQENLADKLNVSRQSVSKWEAGSAMPEIEKLVAMAEVFEVSLDYLLRDDLAPAAAANAVAGAADSAMAVELKEIRQYLKHQGPYEYVSKTHLLGLPLVHVYFSRFNGRLCTAKGIIAIGDLALGLVAIGGLSLGLIGFGGLTIGLLLALGGLALGGLSFGGISIGLVAVGGVAFGIYALGGVAIAKELAMGGVAIGRVAVGAAVRGEYTLLTDGVTGNQIYQFIHLYLPGIPDIFAQFASLFRGGHAR